MAKKRKSGPVVLEPMQIPPHLTRCKVCEKMVWAYATADSLNPPWYLCRECFDAARRKKN